MTFPWRQPGLQYDEALFVRDAVQMLRSAATPPFAHEPRSWIRLGRAFPLMDLPYAGSIKSYLMLLPFAVFGTGAAVCRGAAAFLTAAGIGTLVAAVSREIPGRTGAAVGAALALHPAIVDQTLYDNSAVALWIATLGLAALALSGFVRRPGPVPALLLGAAVGLAVWGRLNFLWLAAAGALSAAIFAPRRDFVRNAAPLAAGFAIGSAPLLLYEALSGLGTLRFIRHSRASTPVAGRVLARLPALAETLLSDGEHRAVWAGPPLPRWQVLFTVVLAAAGLAAALLARRRCGESPGAAAWRRASASTTVLYGATMLASGLGVAEHHLVTIVPVAAIAAALGFRVLARNRAARAALTAAFALWLGLCVSWDARAQAGIRRTGGTGHWSDAIDGVAAVLEARPPGPPVRALTWGLANSVFVLSGGRIAPREVFWGSTESSSPGGRPWAEVVRQGGVFLIGQSPSAAKVGFRAALASSGVAFRRRVFRERRGAVYAELLEVPPPGP